MSILNEILLGSDIIFSLLHVLLKLHLHVPLCKHGISLLLFFLHSHPTLLSLPPCILLSILGERRNPIGGVVRSNTSCLEGSSKTPQDTTKPQMQQCRKQGVIPHKDKAKNLKRASAEVMFLGQEKIRFKIVGEVSLIIWVGLHTQSRR